MINLINNLIQSFMNLPLITKIDYAKTVFDVSKDVYESYKKTKKNNVKNLNKKKK